MKLTTQALSIFLLSCIITLSAGDLAAQVPSYPQPPILINTPTAGVLARGSYSTEMRMMPEGGLLGGVSVGLTDMFMLGVSYGGSHIIGEDTIQWNPQPGVHVKYRVINEGYKYPALAVGFNSQGYHEYLSALERYELKSSGFYVVASKNFDFMGNLGFHAGVNYSLENEDGDNDPNVFVGMDKAINQEISLMVEYDAAINDYEQGDETFSELRKGRGYLNAAVRWSFAEKFHIEFDMNNLLRNKMQSGSLPSRELKILYIEYF